MSQRQQYHDSNHLIPGDSFTVGWRGESVLVARSGAHWTLQRGGAREVGPTVVEWERWDAAVARITLWLDNPQRTQAWPVRRAAS